MTLSEVAIKRPVFTVMVTVALLVLGAVGLSRLGTDLFPDVSFPVVTVTIPYPGASPAEVENLVTKPVEDTVVGLNGIDRVRSFSREGVAQVWVIFKLGTDVVDAATQVRERVSGIRYKFPKEAEDPSVSRLDVSAAPVVTYTIRSSGSLSRARKFVDDVLKPELEQVEGVAAVNVTGGGEREIQVDVDRERLDALNIGLGQVVERLRGENLNVPAGHYDEGVREISVRTVGEFPDVAAIRSAIVATGADGASVRLDQVARVSDGFEEQRTFARVNGEHAVTFDVVKQSGQNTVAVGDKVKSRLTELESRFPAGMRASLIIDQSRFIKNSVTQVKHDLTFGGVMAILVVLLFMLDLRSTLISSLALPTSVIGTFFVMYALGYTLNMMTLLALSLSIGLLIDDAVVVRENIFKHLERGVPAREAALNGTKEIALSVLATTGTILAVFIPVAFVKGMVGQFFRQFGNTVSAAVVLSLFVAFTLDPMLSSRFSKPVTHDKRDRYAGLKRPFLWFFGNLEAGYRSILGWSVRHKWSVGGLAVGSFVFMGFIAGLTGSEFVNAEDRGQFVVEIELPAGISIEETSRLVDPAERRMLENPEVKTVFSTIGPDQEVNKVRWRVVTTPKDQRTVSIHALKAEGRRIAAAVPGAKVVVTDPPFVEGAATEAPIMIDVRGETYEDIQPLANKIGILLRTTPGIQDVNVKFTPGRPELQVELDRAKAAERGLSVAQLAGAMRIAMQGEEAGKLRQGKDEVPIRVRLEEQDRQNPEQLAGADPDHCPGADQARRLRAFRAWRGPTGHRAGESQPADPDLGLAGRSSPGRHRRGHPARDRQARAAQGRQHLLRRTDSADEREQRGHGHGAALGRRVHLHHPGLAVRKLPAPADHHADPAAGHDRRDSRPVLDQEHHGDGRDDRHHPAHGVGHEERHFADRSRHRTRARPRRIAARGRAGSGSGAAPADPDDQRGDGARHAADRDRKQRRQRVSRAHGDRGDRRRVELDPAVVGRGARLLSGIGRPQTFDQESVLETRILVRKTGRTTRGVTE